MPLLYGTVSTVAGEERAYRLLLLRRLLGPIQGVKFGRSRGGSLQLLAPIGVQGGTSAGFQLTAFFWKRCSPATIRIESTRVMTTSTTSSGRCGNCGTSVARKPSLA